MPQTRKELLSWAKDAWEKITGHKEGEVTIKGWVARDDTEGHRSLFFYRDKPIKGYSMWKTTLNGSYYIPIPEGIFPSVQWSDTEPTPATITIKIEK